MTGIKNKRVLITGANGFIGVHLCEKLRECGAFVGTLDQTESQTHDNNSYIGNITDFEFIKKSCHTFQPNFVIHLAAFKGRTTGLDDFREAIDANLMGTLNLIQSLSDLPSLKKFVAVGTAEEYGLGGFPFRTHQRETPISSYSFSKVCMTHLLQTIGRLHQFPAIILRPSIAYGPGQNIDMFLPALIRSLLQDKPFKMTTGSQKRDFVYIEDLIEALILACHCDSNQGEIYNISSSEIITIADVALKIGQKLGREQLIKIGEFPDRKLDIEDYVLDQGETINELGWSSKTLLDKGLDQTITAFRQTLNS
jgi:UDP-glucose 4-epimerase